MRLAFLKEPLGGAAVIAVPQDLTPAAREAKLLRCVRTYLSIYREVC